MAHPTSSEVMFAQIRILDWKFQRSCSQIIMLNNSIEDTQSRFDRAVADCRRTFCYSIRLRLATLEGIRNMFYEYASRLSDRLESLQHQLTEAGRYELGLDDDVSGSDTQTDDED